MASVQERLQINRTPLDKWSKREQLCLASAVSCSGDQNWMSVSRTLKLVCGSSKDTLQARPNDWFSQKNCAVQYGQLLADAETPKRKKRTSENASSPAPVEPPTEAVLRRLAEERMLEIKTQLRKEQEEYAQIYAEIKALQTGKLNDDQVLQMWSDIEKEQEMVRIDEMKMENQMREREYRKQELQRNWRTGGVVTSNTSSSPLKSSTDTSNVDMDVEGIIGSVKPTTANSSNTQAVVTGTSPLLSSLLKSPTATSPSVAISSSSARANAPTITTLLTGGSIPNTHQPAIVPSRDDAIHLLARPLSGPPLDVVSSQGSAQQILLSPSQSAPTLSMLLEKNKSSSLIASDTGSNSLKNLETRISNDSNNELIPMDIEEDLPTTNAVSDADLTSADIDDTDPNEEQQLLEVFKNIGNIDELDIDVSAVINEDDDFLKGVDEEDIPPVEDNLELEQTLQQNVTSDDGLQTKQEEHFNTPNDSNNRVKEVSPQTQDASTSEPTKDKKVDTISSDDSNDNIPLAAVASLESSKDRLNESSNESSFLKEQEESAIPKNEPDHVDLENKSTTVAIKQEMLDEHEASNNAMDRCDDISEKLMSMEEKKDENVFIIPSMEEGGQSGTIKADTEESQSAEEDPGDTGNTTEADDMNEATHLSEQSENNELQQSVSSQLDQQGESNLDSTSFSKLQPPPAISIADTDENSSSTDISVQTRKDEKFTKNLQQLQRKSPHEPRTDDEMPNPSTQMAVPSSGGNLTPRPTAFRKLRDRDRSESPMIDDDATTHSDHSTTTNQRLRRRYSSTPVIDSIPNSPASSDRDESRDLRTYKKSLLSIYNVLQASKHASTLQRILTDEMFAEKLQQVCLKQIDFAVIKKNIESGLIRTVYELQRDVLLMCENALMISKVNSVLSNNILTFQQECQNIREFMPNYCDPQVKHERDARDTKSSGSTSSSTGGGSASKARSGSRKSLRLS